MTEVSCDICETGKFRGTCITSEVRDIPDTIIMNIGEVTTRYNCSGDCCGDPPDNTPMVWPCISQCATYDELGGGCSSYGGAFILSKISESEDPTTGLITADYSTGIIITSGTFSNGLAFLIGEPGKGCPHGQGNSGPIDVDWADYAHSQATSSSINRCFLSYLYNTMKIKITASLLSNGSLGSTVNIEFIEDILYLVEQPSTCLPAFEAGIGPIAGSNPLSPTCRFRRYSIDINDFVNNPPNGSISFSNSSIVAWSSGGTYPFFNEGASHRQVCNFPNIVTMEIPE